MLNLDQICLDRSWLCTIPLSAPAFNLTALTSYSTFSASLFHADAIASLPLLKLPVKTRSGADRGVVLSFSESSELSVIMHIRRIYTKSEVHNTIHFNEKHTFSLPDARQDTGMVQGFDAATFFLSFTWASYS
jgi:hypothetical protein